MDAANKRKVLVTGASGFVGSTLTQELVRQGHDLRVLVRKSSELHHLDGAKLEQVVGDLREPNSLREAARGVEVVFHIAGVISARNREEFFKHNAEGTKNMAEAAAEAGVKRLVYTSSLAAGGPSPLGGRRQEEETPEPVSHYGQSKLGGEKALQEVGARLNSVIIRPPAVYGPRDRGIFTFFETIQKGIVPLLGLEKPDPRRYSFVHVEDLVRGIIAAGFTEENLKPGEIFYISGDGEYSWEHAMETIAKSLDKRGVRLRLPIAAMRCAGAVCSGISKISGKVMPLSLDKVRELEQFAWTCSNAKAKRVLGFTPYWELEKGLQQTARWYRENGWL